MSPLEREATELTDALATLSSHHKAVLEIVALAGEPISLRRLIEIGLPLTAGGEFSPTRVGPVVRELLEAGFLRESGDALNIESHLAEAVAVASKRSGRALLIVAQIIRLETWSGKLQRDPAALLRHFRYYLYSDDLRQARGLAGTLEIEFGRHPWSEVGRRLPDAESFFVFGSEARVMLARETLISSLNTPFPAPHALQAFGRLVRQPEASAIDCQLYAHALLMAQDRETFEDYLADRDFPTALGCRKILDGDLGGLEDFERGLREQRFFASYTALFLYLVALLAREGLDSPRALSEVERFEMFRVPLRWMLAVKAGTVSALSGELRKRLSEPHNALLPHFSLILHWAGFRHPEVDLESRAIEYEAAGYPVFGLWLRHAAGGDVRPAESCPVVDLLGVDEHWRRALAALDGWSAPAREMVASGERLVWHIEPFVARREVEPRLQKLSRKGAWSSGRLLELDEIWSKPPACADSADIKVFDALARVSAGKMQLGYATRLELQHAAMLALVGHPRVYLKNRPESPVELVRGAVALLVRRFPEYLELKLDPPPVSHPMVLAQQDGAQVRLFDISQRHVQLGHMIDSGLKIPLQAETQLKETLAGLAAAGLVVRSDIELEADGESSSADATLLIRLTPWGDGMAVQLRVAPLGGDGPLFQPGEGSPVVGCWINGRNLHARRDLAEESLRWKALSRQFSQLKEADFTLSGALESLSFLDSFSGFHDPRFRLEWPEGERFAVAMQVRLTQLRQRVRSAGDWFSLGAELDVDENLVMSLGDLLDARQRSVGRFVPLEGGRYLSLTTEVQRYLDRLERLAQRQSKGGELQLHPLAALLAVEGEDIQADENWRQAHQRLLASQSLEPELPSDLQAELREYQAEGVRWLLRLAQWGVGACLADDMGLGKTVQLLALLLSRSSLGPALVVAPTSVCWNWAEEALRFAPSLRLHTLGSVSVSLQTLGAGDVLVTSYGLLLNHAETLAAKSWATLVLDEAQAIKNAGTQRARAAQALKAAFRVAATGTPVENNSDELWALFRFLNPGLLGSRKSFAQRFTTEAGQKELARQVRPFILRRTKDEVLKELPPRTEMVELVMLSPQERALYEKLRQDAVRSMEDEAESSEQYLSILAHLSNLRRACCHPRLVLPEASLTSSKLEHAMVLLHELIENGHRALVFSQFVSYLKILRSVLDARGIRYAYLDGSTPAAARHKAVQSFQGGEGDLFLISLKAGGTGLNLTGADYVLHLDPWWNPAVEDQASDRAHRMGQRRPVTVYRLVAKDTIEEKIVQLHEEKRDLADRLLDGTEGSARLSAADLLALLQG